MWMHRQCLSLACVVLLSVWFILGTGNTKLLPTCSTFPLQNTFQSLPGKSLQTSCQPGLQWRQFVYQFTCIPYVPTGTVRKPGAGSHTTALTSSPPLQLIWDTHNGVFFFPCLIQKPHRHHHQIPTDTVGVDQPHSSRPIYCSACSEILLADT